jgi:hypothetical protein
VLIELSHTHGVHLGDAVVGVVTFAAAGGVVAGAAVATSPRRWSSGRARGS